jgi:hypothetical protein
MAALVKADAWIAAHYPRQNNAVGLMIDQAL